jgi:large-conductance mechanosensitive channel
MEVSNSSVLTQIIHFVVVMFMVFMVVLILSLALSLGIGFGYKLLFKKG